MKQLSARAMRRELRQGHEMVDRQLVPAVNGLIENEKRAHDKIENLERFTHMGFLDRLRWIIRGAK